MAVAWGLVAAACSNSDTTSGEGGSPDGVAAAVDAPGVTATRIRVGGVASVTNPLGLNPDQQFDGVDAYFQMVNEAGGVHGRELELVARHDDQLANNDAAVQQLLTQDDVFAVLPVATVLFTGADELVDAGVPTFGWTINPEWEGSAEEPRENLFGQNGSYICFDCSQPIAPYLADQIDTGAVGVLAYNVPESSDCATGVERSFEQHAAPGSAAVVFSDSSLSFGIADLSVQVSQMKDAGVDLVMTCMDLQGVVTLAKEMKRQSLEAVQLLFNGYDQEVLTEFGDLFQGSYVLTFFSPFEVEDPPEGLETYLEWMDRSGAPTTENTMNGWLSAALFVEGLRQAGPDFSRQGVIDAINQMTDWDADGLLAGVDWTTAHTEPTQPVCIALSRIDGEEFVPSFGEPGKPFVCLDREAGGIPEGTASE
ncbi:MAG: ABC transporter substrate-binding protein [Acidimicrobiales bacterium]